MGGMNSRIFVPSDLAEEFENTSTNPTTRKFIMTLQYIFILAVTMLKNEITFKMQTFNRSVWSICFFVVVYFQYIYFMFDQ